MQAVPIFKGKRRLGRAIMKFAGLMDARDLILETQAGKFQLPSLVENISIELFINGYYEKGLVKFLTKNIPPNGVFLDVGANIGSISIPLSRSRPDITIVAVEASPWIFKVLERNIAINNLRNIKAINFAVFDRSGNKVSMYAPKELFGKGSLRAIYTREAETVETITIDEIKARFNLPSIHFIKVDVEGFEASVFGGMSNLLVSDKPKIIFEFSEWAEVAAGFRPREAQSFIISNGYTIQQMDSNFRLLGQPSRSVLSTKESNLFATKDA